MIEPKSNGFIKIEHDLVRGEAWQSLSGGAGWVLFDLWARHNGFNNGAIAYSIREVQHRFRCARNTAIKWLRELEDKGFIVATRRGSFNHKHAPAADRATTWRLTMEPCNGELPTREYLLWHADGPEAEADE